MPKFLTRFGSLKLRLSLVVVCLVLLAVALVTFLSHRVAERHMREVVGSQQYAVLSSAAAYIDQDLASKKVLLASIGEELALREHGAPLAIQRFLEAHRTLHEEFFNVIALAPNGDLIANLNDRRLIATANFSKRDYFIDTIRNREGLISRPFKSALSDHPVVVVTEPVFDAAGKLSVLLVGVLDLQRPRFFGQLEAIKLGKSGYLFMLTEQGVIVHHPDRYRILKNVKEEEGGPVPSTLAAMQGFEGWVQAESKRGIPSLITYKHLHNTDWVIGSVYPVAEAFEALTVMGRGSVVAATVVALAAGLVGWLIVLRLLRPLGALRRHVARISDGKSDIEVFDVDRQDEFGELSRAFFLLSQQRREAEDRLITVTRTDSLTGIPNRRSFDEDFAAALARSNRTGRPIALAYLDIDRFKQINDSYGHGAGDQVLIEFAGRLKGAVRSTDTVARLAGDEFIVIFENLTGNAEAEVLARKILSAMNYEFSIGETSLLVTTSIGIAKAGDQVNAEQLMKAADQALYEAKAAGRNCFVIKAGET